MISFRRCSEIRACFGNGRVRDFFCFGHGLQPIMPIKFVPNHPTVRNKVNNTPIFIKTRKCHHNISLAISMSSNICLLYLILVISQCNIETPMFPGKPNSCVGAKERYKSENQYGGKHPGHS